MAELSVASALSVLRRAISRAKLDAWALAASFGVRPRREGLRLSARGRRIALISAVGLLAVGIAGGAVWWRLASGPLSLDLVTPWMISALEERFGGRYKIEVGGTVLERDEDGETALRLRDIVLRDRAGTVVASAPRAEVGLSASGLLSGHMRAERLNLIGAHMALRIERDGSVTVFAGSSPPAGAAENRSQSAPDGLAAPSPQGAAGSGQATGSADPTLFATLVTWLRTLDTKGFDGRDLAEIGLKNGSITIDDRRTGRELSFGNIDLSLTRLPQGGAALAVTSMGTDGPWSLNATVTTRSDQGRAVEAVVRDISPKDILLALRLDGGALQADMPLSGIFRADFAPDGALAALRGRVLAGAGHLGDAQDEAARILIDEAQVELHWDSESRILNVPIDIHSGANRVALMAQVKPPADPGVWSFAVTKGMLVLGPSGEPKSTPLVLDQINLQATYDPDRRRFELAQAELRGAVTGVALSGGIDFEGGEPRLAVGLAATPMPASAFKRLWPAVVSPVLRQWVEQHFHSGVVQRVEVAARMPVAAILPAGPPLPEDGLSIEVQVRNAAVRPVDGLPTVKDVDIVARVAGRTAKVTVGGGRIELPSGGKVAVQRSRFEVADISQRQPVGQAYAEFAGTVENAAELLGMEPVRGVVSLPFDASTSHGSVTAALSLAMPLAKELPKDSVVYEVEADLSGFGADRFVRGYKAEAGNLHISASRDALHIKGDLRVAGTPASIEYRKAHGEPDAELRVQATLDEAGRTRLGLDLPGQLTGPVAVKMNGRMKIAEREARLAVEADLTQARVSEVLPGWNKAPGRPAKVSFVLVDRGQNIKLEEFALEGSGANVKGSVTLAEDGDLQQANLPTFGVSDGDRASLKVDRTNDGVLKLTLRGDIYDGRGLVKSAMAGQKPETGGDRSRDMDVDIKLGAITGHHGEALRGFELRMSRRGGHIRSFNLAAGLGANARLAGEMRSRGSGQRVLYVETTDAGALFRFTDTYPRIFGGTMSVAMEPPNGDSTPQEGLLNIHDFVVRGEPALDRVVSGVTDERRGGDGVRAGGVPFSRLRVEFTRTLGRFSIRDGVVWGPSIGATVDGTLDFARDEVRLKGTFVPAYGLNNMFSRLPIVGMFLGGGANEGLLGITYQVVGTPRAPVLRVNPMSAIAPGFLRKLFEFRGNDDRGARAGEPTR
ncbi:MAG TPA: DUF3971 domain-containing protein [Xanthobacteraceae bacterium]|nr:DUF3971 domain-containing protein [Xanthobacteraceae bacterium]